MKKMIFNGCTIMITTLLLLVLPAHAQAIEEYSIENAVVEFEGGGAYDYNGEVIEPLVGVKLDGKRLTLGVDYVLSYTSGKDVGRYYVSLSGIGSYTGSITKSYEIRAYKLSRVMLHGEVVKKYDGSTEAAPILEGRGIIPGDEVKIVYASAVYDSQFAGNSKDIIVTGIALSGKHKDNYKLPDNISDGETIFKECGIISPVESDVTYTAELTAGGNTLELSTLVAGAGKETVGFVFLDSSKSIGCSLENGVLTSGSLSGKVTIEVNILEGDINGDGIVEYLSGLRYIQVTIIEPIILPEEETPDPPSDPSDETEDPGDPSIPVLPERKAEQERLEVVLTSDTIAYGETLLLKTIGGSGDGKVTYSIDYGTGGGTIDKNGVLRATQVGSIWIKATKEEDANYKEAESDMKVITVNQAAITITVSKRTIRVGDAVPQLTSSDYVISGLVNGDHMQKNPTLAYASTPNNGRTGTVIIQASGAEVPTGGNYQSEIHYIQGSLTITEQPSYTITLRQPEHGTLSSDYSSATEGTVVTLRTTVPAEYELERPAVTCNNRTVSLTAAGNGYYTFLMPAGPVTVTAMNKSTPQEPEKPPVILPFVDVHSDDWFYDSVVYAYEKGLMNGTGTDSFSPQSTTSRGMIVTILYRMSGSPGVTSYPEFNDVPRDAYYASPVVWSNWNEIAAGYGNGFFGADDPVTRQQLAAILYRYADYRNYNITDRGDLDQFFDKNDIHSYALQPMSWANAVGLINGKGEGILDPCGYATRAEVAAILQRFCENFVVFPDPSQD